MKKNLTRDEVIQELQRIRESLSASLRVMDSAKEIELRAIEALLLLQIRVADAKVIR